MAKLSNQKLSNEIGETNFYQLLLDGVTNIDIKDDEVADLWKQAEVFFKKIELVRVAIEKKLPAPQSKVDAK